MKRLRVTIRRHGCRLFRLLQLFQFLHVERIFVVLLVRALARANPSHVDHSDFLSPTERPLYGEGEQD